MQILLFLAFVIPYCLFLLTQQNTLKALGQYRLMEPGMVWLQLIPVIGVIWQFTVVARIADSIKSQNGLINDEHSILGLADGAMENIGQRPTYKIGIAYCTLITLSVLLNIVVILATIMHLPSQIALAQVRAAILLAGMVCWIVYWVNLASARKKIRGAIAAF